jgi:cysteinyl-tRNA synthetase
VEYSPAALEEAVRAYRRIEGFVRQAAARTGAIAPGEPGPEFAAAMDDDLGTPAALAVVHNAVRQGNIALDSGDEDAARAAAASVRAQTDILGLDPLSAKWSVSSTVDTGPMRALGVLVDELLAERQQARADRDFARADTIRDRLLASGITVEDTSDGPLWTLKDS